jgi:hypothetical protein
MPFLPLDGELLHREGLSKQRRALVSKQMPVAAVQVALIPLPHQIDFVM